MIGQAIKIIIKVWRHKRARRLEVQIKCTGRDSHMFPGVDFILKWTNYHVLYSELMIDYMPPEVSPGARPTESPLTSEGISCFKEGFRGSWNSYVVYVLVIKNRFQKQHLFNIL